MAKIPRKQDHDLLIFGAGPVGSLLALLMARRGLRCGVVDVQDPSLAFGDAFDGRTFSISYGSSLIFEEAGFWQHLLPFAHPIWTIRVTDRYAPGLLDYASQDVGSVPLGYMVESRFLRRQLYQSLLEEKNISLYAPYALHTLDRGPFKVTAHVGDEWLLEAPLAIAADGKNSSLREKASIPCHTWSYDQTCVVFVATHPTPHQGTAYEHFHPHGPLATLPLEEKTSAVVWTDKNAEAETLKTLSPEAFHEALNQRFDSPLGTLTLKGRIWTHPLSGLLAKRLYDRRLALVGDAGHAIHPVAGQGMNLGIRDAKVLSDLMVEAKETGLDLGSELLLEKYHRSRRGDIVSMTLMTHGLVRLFSNEFLWLRAVRSLGLDVFHKLSPVKRLIARKAMGL